MNPVILSLAVGDPPPPSGLPFLMHLPSISRVRLLPDNPSHIGAWVDALHGKRISVDLDAEGVKRLPAGFLASAVRQVRVAVTGFDEIRELIHHIRKGSERPPIVFLLPAQASQPDLQWSTLTRWPAVFLNLIPRADGDFDSELLSDWRRELGERLFVSFPALAACAGDPGAGPCLTRLGLHVYVDVRCNCVKVCDCGTKQSIKLDDEGEWFHIWKTELSALNAQVANACAGCPLWNPCRGGCLTERSDGILRDRFCPWPERSFGEES